MPTYGSVVQEPKVVVAVLAGPVARLPAVIPHHRHFLVRAARLGHVDHRA